MTIPAFGWDNDNPPDINAVNLEKDRTEIAEYAESLFADAPAWQAVTDVNEFLLPGEAPYQTFFQASVDRGLVRLRGMMLTTTNENEETHETERIKEGDTLFVVPSDCHPATQRFLVVAGHRYAITTAGEIIFLDSSLGGGEELHFDLVYPL